MQAQQCRSSSESPNASPFPASGVAVKMQCGGAAERPWRLSRDFDPNPRSPIWRSSAPEPLVWAESSAASMLYGSQDAPNIWHQEALSEAADSLVAGELAQIYQLVKAKNERISEKEEQLHHSECLVAETVGAAKAHLREEVEELLRSSHRELRKEASVQRRRLEDLFQKAQEEFRKAVEWRREARTLKGTVSNEIETREKLQKKVQELLRREKALKQQHELERKRWAEEKEQLQKQALLQQEAQLRPFLETMGDQLMPHSRAPLREPDFLQTHPDVSLRRSQGPSNSSEIPARTRMTLQLDEPVNSEDPQFDPDELLYHAVDMWSSHGSTSTARWARPHREVGPSPLSLVSAWWSVDTVMALGPRGLWGCATLLVAEPVKNQELQSWFLRRWVWHALQADAQSIWQLAAESVKVRKSAPPLPLDLPGLKPEALDLLSWLPDPHRRVGLLPKLRRQLQPLIAAPDEVVPNDADLLWLRPASAQLAVAQALWKDVRQQLLSSERALRQGLAESSAMAEVARTLLSVAALSLAVSPGDGEAALRALARLCAGHADDLASQLPDAMPVLLWLADVTGATGRCPPAEGGTAELASKLLEQLGSASIEHDPPTTVYFLAAALLRSPFEAVASRPSSSLLAVLAQLLCQSVEAATTQLEKPTLREADALERRNLRALRGPLRRWRDQLHEGAKNSQVTVWVSNCIEVLDELSLY
ncbi:unnamed protein product [Symbiodinium natans]|uniref:Uncharacterized protein n=1 Tax=Symbiodinium natans TaxID=878477 RepID=A0A812RV12_9DINO|nr:unnamed protein product [Symbiodinium natans]